MPDMPDTPDMPDGIKTGTCPAYSLSRMPEYRKIRHHSATFTPYAVASPYWIPYARQNQLQCVLGVRIH